MHIGNLSVHTTDGNDPVSLLQAFTEFLLLLVLL